MGFSDSADGARPPRRFASRKQRKWHVHRRPWRNKNIFLISLWSLTKHSGDTEFSVLTKSLPRGAALHTCTCKAEEAWNEGKAGARTDGTDPNAPSLARRRWGPCAHGSGTTAGTTQPMASNRMLFNFLLFCSSPSAPRSGLPLLSFLQLDIPPSPQTDSLMALSPIPGTRSMPTRPPG